MGLVLKQFTEFLAWFTAHQAEYRELCRQIILEMPKEIRDRDKNNFQTLFAIAKLAGGDWLKMITDAAFLLLEDSAKNVQVSLEHRLLMDCYLVITTPMAAKHVGLLRENGLETVAMLEMALLPVVVKMKYHGFAVDREKVAEREKIYAALSQEKAEQVCSLLGAGCPKLGDNRKSGGLLDWIEKITGVRLKNMEYASLLAWGHPIGEALVDYKQHAKRWKLFQAMLKHSARDGRIHATLNQMGAVTGRFSCREINLQQLENGPELFRDCMIASSPDRVLVCGDAKHIELRTACIFATAVTGLRILMDIFLQGEKADPHKNTAANILAKPLEEVAKGDRQKAKAVNFGLLYGQNAEGLLEYAWDTYGRRQSTGFGRIKRAGYSWGISRPPGWG